MRRGNENSIKQAFSFFTHGDLPKSESYGILNLEIVEEMER
jgi:hypothetical protein